MHVDRNIIAMPPRDRVISPANRTIPNAIQWAKSIHCGAVSLVLIEPNVSLDRVRAAVQVPPKIHLDLYAKNQAGEVERLKGLGASEIQWDKRPADADYVILADPEGNRFCVVDLSR